MKFDPSLLGNKFLIQDGFDELLNKIKKSVKFPRDAEPHIPAVAKDNDGFTIVPSNESKEIYDLDAKHGYESVTSGIVIAAYDESINKFSALEGKLAYVSHSLVYLYEDDYYPINKLTLAFVTKSHKIKDNIPDVILAENRDLDTQLNVEIAIQKKEFIAEYICDNTFLLIDGPFLAGDGSAYFKGVIKNCFLDRNVFSIFIVKNSFSTSIINLDPNLRYDYNSDLHWANSILRGGQRTKFYKYTDAQVHENSKMFCYLKFFDNYSPIRVEIPTMIYERHLDSINSAMDVIYYLILAQGSVDNPQTRPIAIAEMYARDTLKLIPFNKEMNDSKLTLTMNQNRGMEYDG